MSGPDFGETFTEHILAGDLGTARRRYEEAMRISELNERLAKQKLYLEDELKTEFNFEEIIGQSAPVLGTAQAARAWELAIGIAQATSLGEFFAATTL